MARSKKINLSDSVAAALKALGVKPTDAILVGVSGGIDSVVLANIIHSLQKKKIFSRLGIAHIDHQLRGKESDRDRSFVGEVTKKLRTELFLHSENIAAIAQKEKISLEEAGREVRYSFFKECAVEYNFQWIATAHNADDRVETILMNIIRGAGIRGLRGIPAQRKITKNVTVIRPLLDHSREEIASYAKEKKLRWREDSSNSSSEFTRNRIRASVIPALTKAMPDRNIIDGFRRLGENADSVIQYISKQVEVLKCKSIIKVDSLFVDLSERRYDRNVLAKSESIIVRELIVSEIEELLGSYFSITSAQWKKIESMIFDSNHKRIQIAKNIFVSLAEPNIFFIEVVNPIEKINQTLGVGEKLVTPIGQISLQKTNSKKIDHSSNLAYLRADLFESGLLIRNWKPSDKMQPFGMKGTKLVSDILAEAGVRTEQLKRRFPLVVLAHAPNTVIWVPGVRASELCRITPNSETAFLLKRKIL